MSSLLRISSYELPTFHKSKDYINDDTCKCPSPCEDVTYEPSISYASLSEYAIKQGEQLDVNQYEKTLSKTIVIRNDLDGNKDYIAMTLTLVNEMIDYFKEIQLEYSNIVDLSFNWTNLLYDTCYQSMDDSLNKKEQTRWLYYYGASPEEISRDLSLITFDFRSYIILLLKTLSIGENSTDIYNTVATNAISTRKDIVAHINYTIGEFLNYCVSIEVCDSSVVTALLYIDDMDFYLDGILQHVDDIYSGLYPFDISWVEWMLQGFEYSAFGLKFELLFVFNWIDDVFEHTTNRYLDIKETCNNIHYKIYEIEGDMWYIYDDKYYFEYMLVPYVEDLRDLITSFEINRNDDNMTETYIQSYILEEQSYLEWFIDDVGYAVPYLSSSERLWENIDVYMMQLQGIEHEHQASIQNISSNFYTVLYDLQNPKRFANYLDDGNDHFYQAIADIGERIEEDKKLSTIDSTFYRLNFIHVSVSMKDMSYTHIKQQEAYDIFALMSDIGGLMGLFIGGSVVSILELIDFLIDLGYIVVKKKL